MKGTNWLLAGILSLLGFTGCETTSGKDEYGSPHADYTVKGKVVDKATQEPIPGVRVSYYPDASTTTDTDGEFELTTNHEVQVLLVDDVDDDENGAYESEEIPLDFSEAEHTPGSGWYKGEYTLTENVELDEVGTQE